MAGWWMDWIDQIRFTISQNTQVSPLTARPSPASPPPLLHKCASAAGYLAESLGAAQ